MSMNERSAGVGQAVQKDLNDMELQSFDDSEPGTSRAFETTGDSRSKQNKG